THALVHTREGTESILGVSGLLEFTKRKKYHDVARPKSVAHILTADPPGKLAFEPPCSVERRIIAVVKGPILQLQSLPKSSDCRATWRSRRRILCGVKWKEVNSHYRRLLIR